MNEARPHRRNGLRGAIMLAMATGLGSLTPGNALAKPQIEISVDDAQINEGNSITYRVEMTNPPPTPEIIPVSVQIWSAATGTNPVPVNIGDMGHHRLWFTEGVERHALSVRTTRDTATNATTTVTAKITSSARFTISGGASVGAAVTDHSEPVVEVGAGTRTVTVNEGETAQLIVELDDTAQADLNVNIRTEVTAGAGSHYPRLHPSHIGTRTVLVRRGQRRAFVPVASHDDNAVNGDKTVTLTVLAGTGYTVASDNAGTATFLGDIAASATDARRQGADTTTVRWAGCGRDRVMNEGGNAAQLTVEVEGSVDAQWTFTPSTNTNAKYTAEAAEDFIATNAIATHTMEPFEKSRTFTVSTVNDEAIEAQEKFALDLTVNGPIAKNVKVSKRCGRKVARIIDDDIANLSVGKQTRRVVEGAEIALQIAVDADTGTTCPIPFAITVRGRAHGTAAAINTLNANARGTRTTNIAACAGGPATITFPTREVQGDQGTRKVVIELWTTDANSEARDPRHARIEIDGARSALAKYTVYIDESDTSTPVNIPGTKVRLQGGATPNQGRLEVFHDSAWGTVCDDYWNNSSAGVACRSLGFPAGTVKPAHDYTRAYYGAGAANLPIHFDDVRCNGSETTLFDCRRRANGHNCKHNEDVGVNCLSGSDPAIPEGLPIVIMDVRSSTLKVNEGDEAVFWVERIEAGTTALKVDVIVTALNGDAAQSPAQSYLGFPEEDIGPRTVTIPAGRTRASFAVTLQDDDVLPENHPQAKADLVASTRYQLGATHSATATYTDGSYRITEAGQREFDDTDDYQVMGWKDCGEELVVNEDDGVAQLVIESQSGKTAAYSHSLVRVNMEGGASRHNDYNDADGTGPITIEPFTTERAFDVRIIKSRQIEYDESFTISMFRNSLTDHIVVNSGCSLKSILILDTDIGEFTIGERVRTVTEGDEIVFNIDLPSENGQHVVPFPVEAKMVPDAGSVGALAGNTGEAFTARITTGTKHTEIKIQTTQSAGDQGTHTVHFDATIRGAEDYQGDIDDRSDRVFLEGTQEAVRYTVHISDSEASTTIDPNQPRGVDPPRGKKPNPATPVTATLHGVPDEHDGSNAFTFELHFAPSPKGLSYRTVQDALFAITNGQITKAKRLVPKQSQAWEVSVQPSNDEDLSIRLRATPQCDEAGAVCTAQGGALKTGLTRTVPGPVKVSVAGAAVDEAPGATLEFEVRLSRAANETITVDYATADASARAGEDYNAAAGTATFASGSTKQSIAVTVRDDSHNEGAETFELRLSNPTPARVKLADAIATGTIRNSDPMPKTWMTRFGRTLGSQVVEGISGRIHTSDHSHVSVGGIEIGTSGDETPQTQWRDSVDPLGEKAAENILRTSSFHWSNATDGAEETSTVNAWGRFASERFEADESNVAMGADVTTGLLGVDAQWARGLAGVMLSWTRSEGTYHAEDGGNAGQGDIGASMSGVYPYASIRLNERILAWGLVGGGSGELMLERKGERALPTDLTLRMGAVGLTGQILDGSGPSGIELDAKSDVMRVWTRNAKTDDLIATKGDVSRIRLRVQGARSFSSPSGATFTPNMEIGFRHDAGDAETGAGVEIGAGARYDSGALSAEGRVRGLVAHEERGYEEWGASATVEFAPGRSGRGLSLAITPRWGTAHSAADQLWSAGSTKALGLDTRDAAGRHLDLLAGYGVGLGADRGVLTPYAGMTLGADAGRTMRGGAWWRLGENVQMNIEALRESTEQTHETKLRVGARVQF